jgi:hypothetical protein
MPPRVPTAKALAGNSTDFSGIAEQGPFNRATPIGDAPVARLELLYVALLGKGPESFLDLGCRHLFAPRERP